MKKFRILVLIASSLAFSSVVIAECADGVPLVNPDSDYIDNGDGTVTHKPTGLMWMRCGYGLNWDAQTKGCVGVGENQGATYVNWSTALEGSAELDFAGHSDWRIPNINELRSLVEWSCSEFSINSTFFPVTYSDSVYWSSTTVMSDPTMGRVLNFKDGEERAIRKNEYIAVARAVRGGN
ncbi:MAG: DUF1566 domain-containing protein [Oceanobacter sp.]